MPMKKEQVDLENAVSWIPDSKTPNGIAELPLRSVLRTDTNLGIWAVAIPQRREFYRLSEESEDGLAIDVAPRQDTVLPNL